MIRFILAGALALCAPAATAEPSAAGPRVVTDIAPVQSLVAMVLGEGRVPPVLVPPGASPHGLALRPSQAGALQDADLVVWIGPGLTPWLAKPLEALAGDATALELMAVPGTRHHAARGGHGHDHGDQSGDDGQGAAQEGKGDAGHDGDHAHDDDVHDHDHDHDHAHDHDHDHDHGHDDGHHDHDHDDGHHDHDHAHDDGYGHAAEDHDGGPDDPHAWLDPRNAAVWLDAIAEALAAADPAHAAGYRARAGAAQAALLAVDAELDRQLEPVQGTAFVTYHDAFQYFERRYGLSSAGSIAHGDAAAPGPAWLRHIQEEIGREGVACILTEPQFPPRLAEVAADGRAVRLGVLDPLGSALTPGAAFYPALLRGMGQALAECLAGR